MQRIRTRLVPCFALLAFAGVALAQAPPPAATPTPAPAVRHIASPRGTAAIEVGGKYVASDKAGVPPSYNGGKWIELTYYRPILRGRTDLFAPGPDYGKKLNAGAPVWRAGANLTTRLKTEAAIEIGGKRIEPGEYSLFIDLKENAWTLIVSTQPFQKNYDANDKGSTWGAYFYDQKFDVVRVPMKLEKAAHSAEALVLDFVDVGEKDGKLALWWEKEFATADFKILN